MTLILKDVYIDKLDEVANKYDNTYHRTINMKPVDVNKSSYIEFKKPLKKFNTVKGKKFCNNCFRDDYFTSKCKSKNTYFKEGCFVKHHTTLHDYFLLKQKMRDKDRDKHIKDGKYTKKEG